MRQQVSTFCFINRKGGVGKSTLCASLAVASGDALILDADPQGSVSQWHKRRGNNPPECIKVIPPDIQRTQRRSKRAYTFIDTAGDLTALSIIQMVDLVIIPIRASLYDLKAVDVGMLGGKKGVFVINSAPHKRIIGEHYLVKEAHAVLKSFNLPIAPVVIRIRIAYIHATIAGKGVTEWDDPKAAREIKELWEWLKDL